MNALVRLSLAGVVLAGLSACAGTHQVAKLSVPPASQEANRIVPDYHYMARVEQVARRRGVGVHWINPPIRRVDSGVNQ